MLAKPFAIPLGWRVWQGFDYGWTHYTTDYLFAQSDDGIVYAVAEYGARRRLPERHVRDISGMLSRHRVEQHQLLGTYAGTDVFSKSRDGTTIAEDYDSNGLPLTPANTDRINGAAEMLRRLGDPSEGIDADLLSLP